MYKFSTMELKMIFLLMVNLCVALVASDTDQQFQRDEIKDLITQLTMRIDQQDQVIASHATQLRDQTGEVTQLKKVLVSSDQIQRHKNPSFFESRTHEQSKVFLQSANIDERVTFLEFQMVFALSGIAAIEQDIDSLEDEQFLQDQRIYDLEKDADTLEEDFTDLQATTLNLDYRVTNLEENGGGNANITQLETTVTELETVTGDQENSIMLNQENIEELQLSDTILEERVAVLEENTGGGGSGNNKNGTVAFFVTYPPSSTPLYTNVLFQEVLVNDGFGYRSGTGYFRVPSGGDGLYYFSTYLIVSSNEWARFNIRVNGLDLCTAWGENDSNINDDQQAACSGLAQLVEGDIVSLVYGDGSDTTPFGGRSSTTHYNGFTGFRL